MLQARLVPCLRDNYAFLLHDDQTGVTAVVDPAEAGPVHAALDALGWTLSLILNTHHHFDHVGANLDLKASTGARVIGPAADAARIPGIDETRADGDPVSIGASRGVVWDIPAHTRGHIAYHFADDALVCVGDTLFAAGCGRLFEGSPAQLWHAMRRLRALPDHTRVYCAHEYTASNIRFALSVDPDNRALIQRAHDVASLRAQGTPTVPTTIGAERETNPFMRGDDPTLAAAVGLPQGSPAQVVGALRALKDTF